MERALRGRSHQGLQEGRSRSLATRSRRLEGGTGLGGAAGWALLLGQPSLPCREPVTAARGPKHPWPCLLPAPGGNTFAWMGECTLPLGYGRKWPPPIPREFHRAWKHLCGFIWTEKVLAQLHISRLKSDLGQAVSGACLFVQELKVSSDGKRRDFSC